MSKRKIVVEVQKNSNENNTNLMRRFSRKVQETGIIQKVKSKRYNTRPPSKLAIKEGALKRMARRKEYNKLFKLGKVIVRKKGRR